MHKKDGLLAFCNLSFFRAIIDFFFPPLKKSLTGKLFVSGHGRAEFTFKYPPDNVFVYFTDENEPIPCNPGEFDFLDWSILEQEHHYYLIIEWNVLNTRSISWKVC